MSTAQIEDLMPKLISILSILTQKDSLTSVQNKQALVKAINEFKESVAQAKAYANVLPGGELAASEQDGIISMLESMKETQRTLLQSALHDLTSFPTSGPGEMQIDSTASTPVGN